MKDNNITMNVPLVDLNRQHAMLRQQIDNELNTIILRGDFINGVAVKEFEEAFANYCGAEDCIGVGNGTDALFLAMKACGIGAGDEVITVANTFIATAEAITAIGAKCVFVDIDPSSYLIDPALIAASISEKTKAIIPVHLYGQLADMDRIMDIANQHGLIVIEDAAQAHGAQRNGKRAGSFGHAACFSFYPGKNLGAFGDAGAIVTSDQDIAKKARLLANHGRLSKYDHEIVGYNSRLDSIQAAILSVKLPYLDDWNKCRVASAKKYSQLLGNSEVILPSHEDTGSHVFHLYVVRVAQRDLLKSQLSERGVQSGVHYPIALPNTEAYRNLGHHSQECPIAAEFSREILSVPIFPMMQDQEIEYIAAAMHELCQMNGAA